MDDLSSWWIGAPLLCNHEIFVRFNRHAGSEWDIAIARLRSGYDPDGTHELGGHNTINQTSRKNEFQSNKQLPATFEYSQIFLFL